MWRRYEIQYIYVFLYYYCCLTTSILIKQHQDMKDIDCQCALTTGKYEGGDLLVWDEAQNRLVKFNTPNNPTLVDGRIPHMVTVVLSGTRYHLIIYRHYQKDFSGQHAIYDVAQFHPDSQQISILDKNGYFVPKLGGLERVHGLVDKFLFEDTSEDCKSLKSGHTKALKNNWLYLHNDEEVGVDENRYILENMNIPEDVVAVVSTALRSVWAETGVETEPILTDFGFLLRTEDCGMQPIHIDGEKDNSYFVILPILEEGERYKLYALKVSDSFYNCF